MRRPTQDDDGRKIGYAQEGTEDSGYTDAEVRDSARQWRVSDPAAVVAAGHALVVVATFVVALLQVTDVADDVTRRH